MFLIKCYTIPIKRDTFWNKCYTLQLNVTGGYVCCMCTNILLHGIYVNVNYAHSGQPAVFLAIKDSYVVFFILCMAMECFYGKSKVGWTGILSESSWPEDKTFSLRRNWLKFVLLKFYIY